MEATKLSLKKEMDKQDILHIYNGILLSHKRNTVVSLTEMWIDLCYAKSLQSCLTLIQNKYVRKRNNIADVGSKKMVQMNLLAKQK